MHISYPALLSYSNISHIYHARKSNTNSLHCCCQHVVWKYLVNTNSIHAFMPSVHCNSTVIRWSQRKNSHWERMIFIIHHIKQWTIRDDILPFPPRWERISQHVCSSNAWLLPSTCLCPCHWGCMLPLSRHRHESVSFYQDIDMNQFHSSWDWSSLF